MLTSAKRDYIRHRRPDGVFIAKDAGQWELRARLFTSRPDTGADDATVVAQMKSICDESNLWLSAC